MQRAEENGDGGKLYISGQYEMVGTRVKPYALREDQVRALSRILGIWIQEYRQLQELKHWQ